jgi:putative ABC transport system ATP-binding protein
MTLARRRRPPDNPVVLFELDDVTLRRDGKEVLRDLSARIPAGATCVAGPSGCGKSTLLRLLNRLADPLEGTVHYRGSDVRERDVLELRREVALVPQLPALLDGSVEENIRFAAELAGLDPDVARLLDHAGLGAGFADRPADRLSVGEQQRTMLARALAVQPSVLLLDEPTSALDERARDAIEATVADLGRRLQIDVVLVTHDLDQARRLAQWVVRMDEGHVVEQGPVGEVLAALA